MITFFRKIRKKFISNSSLGKYVFYATGEILLVMIGILLALQVNEWRDGIISKKEEIRSISLLIEEIENDHESMLLYRDQLIIQDESLKKFLHSIKLNEGIDSLKQNAFQATNVRLWRPSYPYYEGLKQSGSLKIISDPDIRNFVIDYYENLIFYLNDLRELYQNSVLESTNKLRRYVGNEPGLDGNWTLTSYKNLELLKDDVETLHTLGESGNYREFLARRVENLFIPRNEELKEILKGYLNKITEE